MAKLEFIDICKKFGKVTALDHIGLVVEDGEFLSILGPSGCGKTTALRVIAGLAKPDHGDVSIGGKIVTNVPPRFRKIGMVFQNYALFPHMSVFANLAFGLKVEKMDKHMIKAKIKEVLATVELSGFEDRYPNQLSGGQQQRVALARALVKNPEILLLDEPLSNLDAKLRQQMRTELKQIQKKLNITAIFVTHDQEEAISMSDRVVVMEKGRVIQVGTPVQIYERPCNSFVADFIGNTNIIRGEITSGDSSVPTLKISDRVSIFLSKDFLDHCGKEVTCSIRPDRITIQESSCEPSENQFCAKILSKMYMGQFSSYIVSVSDELNLMIVKQNTRESNFMDTEGSLFIRFDPRDLVVVHEK